MGHDLGYQLYHHCDYQLHQKRANIIQNQAAHLVLGQLRVKPALHRITLYLKDVGDEAEYIDAEELDEFFDV